MLLSNNNNNNTLYLPHYSLCRVSCLFHFRLTIIRHSHVPSCMSARTMLSAFVVLADAIKALLRIISVLRFIAYSRRYSLHTILLLQMILK